jgi:integrase
MSVGRRGHQHYVVRWREGGRGAPARQQTFKGPTAKKDAEFFDASIRRARQLGQLANELIGSEQTVADFLEEWWAKHAQPILAPGTLASYAPTLDKWVVPYLGRLKLRDLSREAIDTYRATLLAAGAGAPTVNRCLGILQGIFQRAVEWRRISANPVAGVARVRHVRDEAIRARDPETVEAIRRRLHMQDAALVSVLAYEGLRPAEAFALQWRDVLEDTGRPRTRLIVERALSDHSPSSTKSQRSRQPELFKPVAKDLVELALALGRPNSRALVFPDADGGYLRRQNWRQRVWVPALAAAAIPYFRPYDLRHTCATLLIYEGRTVNEVAQHLGHADPGFTARTYAHVLDGASKRRRVGIEDAVARARQHVVGVIGG